MDAPLFNDHASSEAMFVDAGHGHSRPDRGGRVLAVGSLAIDLASGTATRAGHLLRLHPKQFAVLVYLACNVNRVVSRQAIARDVWGDDTATWTNVITVHVSGLRKEVDREGMPALLHTVRGRGYCLGELPT